MTKDEWDQIEYVLKEINSSHLEGFKKGWLDIEEEIIEEGKRVRLYTQQDNKRKQILGVTLPLEV